MIRRPRLWNKKRGSRLSGWELWGTVGETLFFAGLVLVGAFGLGLMAALRPGFGFWTLLISSLSLLVVGIAGVSYRILDVGASDERRSAIAKRAAEIEIVPGKPKKNEFPNVPQLKNITDSPGTHLAFRLPSVGSPVWNLAAAATLALLWNGCALALSGVAIASIIEWDPRYILILLLIPIFSAGAWTLRRFIDQVKRWTGVGATIVEISSHPLHAGEDYEVYVGQFGRLKLDKISVELVCEEESTFRQGTDIRVEKEHVFRELVHSGEKLSIDPGAAWEQKFTLQIPTDGMHSFKSSHNAITWWIEIHGEAKPWPSYFRRFPVVVQPQNAALASNR